MGVSQKITTLATVQTLTGAWVNLGGEINLEYVKTLGLWIKLNINDSVNVRVRALAKYEEFGDDPFTMPIKAVSTIKVVVRPEYIEFGEDSDQCMLLQIDTARIVPLVQIQVMAETVGASAGIITYAKISSGR